MQKLPIPNFLGKHKEENSCKLAAFKHGKSEIVHKSLRNYGPKDIQNKQFAFHMTRRQIEQLLDSMMVSLTSYQ
jgi:hypothetical protein